MVLRSKGDSTDEKKIEKAYLMPFMSVAGDHAKNDMGGDEDDSWKSIFTKAGIQCIPILKGTAEYQDSVNIWVSHIRGPLSHFEGEHPWGILKKYA